MTFLWVLLAIALILVFYFVGIYNKLVQLKNRFKNAYSQIDVQLKRRHNLVPNLVEVVKGYAKHEREVLERVVEARNRSLQAQGPAREQAQEPAHQSRVDLHHNQLRRRRAHRYHRFHLRNCL